MSLKMNEDIKTDWKSVHIYYQDSHDKILRECLLPLGLSLIDTKDIATFFFLRYWKNGPHVRMRFKFSSSDATYLSQKIMKHIDTYLKTFPSQTRFTPTEYNNFTKQYAINEGEQPSDDVILNNIAREEVYFPEYHKYGGTKGVALAETIFTSSSRCISNLILEESNTDRKVIQGYIMLCVGLNAFGMSYTKALEFLRFYFLFWNNYHIHSNQQYLEQWSQFYEENKDYLQDISVKSLTEKNYACHSFQQWHEAVSYAHSTLQDQKDEIYPYVKNIFNHEKFNTEAYLLMNYLHCHNNRYGIIPTQEAFLGYIGMRCLQDL